MPLVKHSVVGIVMLNWDGLPLTQKCLASLAKQSFDNYLTVVVDNGSSDGSREWLMRQKHVALIANDKNLGFAKAINQGITKVVSAGCKYVVTLNNDTTLDRKWLENLVAFMESRPDIGFAQGATMQQADKTLYDSSGIYLERGFIPNQRALGQDDPRLEMPVIGPNAAGAIYRVGMLENVKLANGDFFDGRFFAYVEDVDLNLRCTLRGYSFGFVPEAKLYHVGSATGNRIAKHKMFWGARNLVWLVYKNCPPGVWKQTRGLIIKSHLANLQFLWREQRPNFFPYLRGLCVGLLSLPLFRKDRRTNLEQRVLSNDAILQLLIPSNPPLLNPLKRVLNLIK